MWIKIEIRISTYLQRQNMQPLTWLTYPIIDIPHTTVNVIFPVRKICALQFWKNDSCTYTITFLPSVNTRSRNSPSSFGSKVLGMITYFPGFSLKRLHTSRRLINVGDRAILALYLKYLIGNGVGGLLSVNWK